MESTIASAIRLELEPAALVWAEEKPEGAMEFTLGKDMLSLSVTPAMFRRMEENVEDSFLQRETWKSLLE